MFACLRVRVYKGILSR